MYRELNIEMFTRKRSFQRLKKKKKRKRKIRNKFDGKEIVVSTIPTVHCVYSVQSYVSPFTIVFHSCHKDTRDGNRVEKCLQSVTKTEYRVNNIHRLDFSSFIVFALFIICLCLHSCDNWIGQVAGWVLGVVFCLVIDVKI